VKPNDVFHCKKLHCTLLASRCVERQLARYPASKAPVYGMCNTREECAQGTVIRETIDKDFVPLPFREFKTAKERAIQRAAKKLWLQKRRGQTSMTVLKKVPDETVSTTTETQAVDLVSLEMPTEGSKSGRFCKAKGCKSKLRVDSSDPNYCHYHSIRLKRRPRHARRQERIAETSSRKQALHRFIFEAGRDIADKASDFADSFTTAPQALRLLYPDGVKPDQLEDTATLIRIWDSMSKIAHCDDQKRDETYKEIFSFAVLRVSMGAGESHRVVHG